VPWALRRFQQAAKLDLRDRLSRGANPVGQQLQERAQAHVIEMDGRADHFGRGSFTARLDDRQQLLRKIRGERFHSGRV